MSLIAGRGCRWPPRRDSVSPCAPLSGGGGRDTHDGHENSPILVFFSNLLGQFDNEGQRSVTMETDTLGSPFITLYEEGRSRTTMGVTQRAAVINMSDAQRPRLVLGVAEDGAASVSFLDENGEVEAQLPAASQ